MDVEIIEINNKRYSVTQTSQLCERIKSKKANYDRQLDILSEICQENDISRYGAEADKVANSMNKIFAGVRDGNDSAKVELNAVQSIVIEKQIVSRLNLLGKLALAERVPLRNEYDDTVDFEFSYRLGEAARIQDYHASFPFATYAKGKTTMKLQQITAGAATEYYRLNDQSITTFAKQSRDAVNELYNTAERYMFTTGYELIKNNKSPMKLLSIGAGGISKAKVDEYLGYLRQTGGTPVIYGTYSMLSQMRSWESFDMGNGTSMYSQKHMDELRNNGVIGKYNGSPVVMINEGLNISGISENAQTGQKWYSSVLPKGLMYILPSNMDGDKVLRFAFGRLNSMSGENINTGTIVKRWDISFGSAMIPTALPFVAIIGDDRYPVTM